MSFGTVYPATHISISITLPKILFWGILHPTSQTKVRIKYAPKILDSMTGGGTIYLKIKFQELKKTCKTDF